MQFLNSGNEKGYQTYRELPRDEQIQFLAEKETQYLNKHAVQIEVQTTIDKEIQNAGRKRQQRHGDDGLDRFPNGDERTHVNQAQALGSVPTLPGSGMVRTAGGSAPTVGVLHGHAPHDSHRQATGDSSSLRRDDSGHGKTSSEGGESSERLNPVNESTGRRGDSVIAQYRRDFTESKAIAAGDAQEDIKTIRMQINAHELLATLSQTHGVKPSKFQVIVSQFDGSQKIKAGKLTLSPNDFLTKIVHLPWKDAEQILRTEYNRQKENAVSVQPVKAQPNREMWQEFMKQLPSYQDRKVARNDAIKAKSNGQRKDMLNEIGRAKQEVKQAKAALVSEYKVGTSNIYRQNPNFKGSVSKLHIGLNAKETEIKNRYRAKIDAVRDEHDKPMPEKYIDWLQINAQQANARALEELN